MPALLPPSRYHHLVRLSDFELMVVVIRQVVNQNKDCVIERTAMRGVQPYRYDVPEMELPNIITD